MIWSISICGLKGGLVLTAVHVTKVLLHTCPRQHAPLASGLEKRVLASGMSQAQPAGSVMDKTEPK
jgi:hypothetical protein